MPDELGEIAVNVKEEGTQDALDSMSEASADADQQEAGGGGLGEMLGGISTKLLGILGFVTFLASLKPIQELLSGIQRIFSTAIMPFIGMMMTVLRPVMQKLLRFIGNLDLDNLWQDLSTKLTRIIGNIADDINRAIKDAIPFVNPAPEGQPSGVSNAVSEEQLLSTGETESAYEEMYNFYRQNEQDSQPVINITNFREQSNTSMDENATETFSRNVFTGGPGGQ